MRHENQRRHVPNPGKSKSADHQGLATIRKDTLPPKGENILNGSKARQPVIFFEIAKAQEYPKELDLDRRSLKCNVRVRTIGPRTQPKTLRRRLIKLSTRATFKKRVSFKASQDGIIGGNNQGRTVSILSNRRQG